MRQFTITCGSHIEDHQIKHLAPTLNISERNLLTIQVKCTALDTPTDMRNLKHMSKVWNTLPTATTHTCQCVALSTTKLPTRQSINSSVLIVMS
jgi:hypothetical protein